MAKKALISSAARNWRRRRFGQRGFSLVFARERQKRRKLELIRGGPSPSPFLLSARLFCARVRDSHKNMKRKNYRVSDAQERLTPYLSVVANRYVRRFVSRRTTQEPQRFQTGKITKRKSQAKPGSLVQNSPIVKNSANHSFGTAPCPPHPPNKIISSW